MDTSAATTVLAFVLGFIIVGSILLILLVRSILRINTIVDLLQAQADHLQAHRQAQDAQTAILDDLHTATNRLSDTLQSALDTDP